MLTISTMNVIVVSIAFHLDFRRHEQSWDSCVTRCTCVHSRNAREISRRSIGVVRVGGFCNNVPIAKDPCILFTKKVGTAKNSWAGSRQRQKSWHWSSAGVLWERPSFSSCGWCWAPAMEEKVVQHWGCRPSHQCSSDTHSMRSRRSFLTSTPWSAFCARCR